jgi:tRNA-specific 2-thiouridylase
MKKVKALVLLSGGLDSILATKILQNQGIKITALSFKSCFFDEKAAQKAARNLKIPMRIIDFSREHLDMVKKPKHGYGRSMNPCIDCHILMLKKAKEIMKKNKFDLVATGEVLGERPMSQNLRTLKLIEKESSLKGYLLRPLSEKLLAETIPEKRGLVKREKLLDIAGRSRKKQIALAKKWRIKWYPTPAGGCLLTDAAFGRKLKELFEKYSGCSSDDIELLKVGRHFWLGKIKVIVGRNHQENQRIKKLSKKRDVLIEMENYPGPLTLIRNYGKKRISQRTIKKASYLTQSYSARARNKKDVKFKITLST